MISALIDNDQNTARVALVSLWDFFHNVGEIKSTNGANWKPAGIVPQPSRQSAVQFWVADAPRLQTRRRDDSSFQSRSTMKLISSYVSSTEDCILSIFQQKRQEAAVLGQLAQLVRTFILR